MGGMRAGACVEVSGWGGTPLRIAKLDSEHADGVAGRCHTTQASKQKPHVDTVSLPTHWTENIPRHAVVVVASADLGAAQ